MEQSDLGLYFGPEAFFPEIFPTLKLFFQKSSGPQTLKKLRVYIFGLIDIQEENYTFPDWKPFFKKLFPHSS